MGDSASRGAGAEVPPEVLARLRPLCAGLPEAYEQAAWVGVRWRIRTRTFAHVRTADPRQARAFARAAAIDEPATVLTFRSSGPELDALVHAGPPFFKVAWGPEVVGMVLGPDVEWDEVAELLTESYCLLAPKRLAALVSRP